MRGMQCPSEAVCKTELHRRVLSHGNVERTGRRSCGQKDIVHVWSFVTADNVMKGGGRGGVGVWGRRGG
jgi:hypothetical protein